MAPAVQIVLSLCACILGSSSVVLPRLPIEVHGFNDLGMWPQVLMKGVRWGKLDFSLCTRASCAAYSTWNTGPNTGNSSDCVSDGSTDLCCICLSGDAGTRPYVFDPFNTSYDLLGFLSDPTNRVIFPRASDPNPLMLGMDWGGSTAQGITTPVISHFLLELQATIARLGLGIVPYGDAGLSGWLNTLDIECSNPGACTDQQLQLQALPWPTEAGPSLPPLSQDPYGRYCILNAPWSSFSDACKTSAWAANGALGRATSHPFLWYESTMQVEYEALLNESTHCATLPANRSNVNTGLVVVSNQASESEEESGLKPSMHSTGITLHCPATLCSDGGVFIRIYWTRCEYPLHAPKRRCKEAAARCHTSNRVSRIARSGCRVD